MKGKHFLLTVIAMLLLNTDVNSKVAVDRIGSTLRASTDIVSAPGYKGCTGMPKLVEAYIFQLYKKTEKEDVCYIGAPPPDWVVEEVVPTNNNSYEFYNLDEGDYKVVVLSANPIGCEIEEKNTKAIIYDREHSGIITIPEKTENKAHTNRPVNGEEDIILFPNPTNDLLKIKIKGSSPDGNATIQILNTDGVVVYSSKVQIIQEEWYSEINTASFKPGNYIVTIVDDNKKLYTKQLVILHANESSGLNQQNNNIKN